MAPYVAGERGAELQKHYAPDVERIEKAYTSEDFEKEFPIGLASLIIDVGEPK